MTSGLHLNRAPQLPLGRRPARVAQVPFGYGLLFVPYLVAELLAGHPGLSYWIAWSGSWLVLYLVMSGRVRPLPQDRPMRDQILRPVFLTHAVFATYTALSSLPYFLEIHGYYYLARDGGFPVDVDLVARTAAAQRYYLLAHASFASGILLAMDYRASGAWRVRARMSLPGLLLSLSASAFVAALLASQFGPLAQLAVRLKAVALFSSVLCLAVALPTRRPDLMWAGLTVYLLNFAAAVISGWKKEVMVIVTLLLVFAFPYYRRTVLTLGPLLLVGLLLVLPAYNAMFRELSWSGTATRSEAARATTALLRRGDVPLADHTWAFFVGRASEIGLFVRYLEFTPAYNDFAGTTIARRAITGIVPRIVWPEKPNLELATMERVYANNVVDRASAVSAKPQIVVDGYLSAGALGVMITCLLFGLCASLASRLAEKWFGGYLLGSGVVYTSLFVVFWSGNAFEFVVPMVFWSFMVMWFVAVGGRWLHVLVPQRTYVPRPLHPARRVSLPAATRGVSPTHG